MFVAKKGEMFQRGTWRKALSDGHSVVNLCCPQCGAYGQLLGPDASHQVAADGTVSPSVLCDCGWHEMVRLDLDPGEGRLLASNAPEAVHLKGGGIGPGDGK
jgi:hypothetical protein